MTRLLVRRALEVVQLNPAPHGVPAPDDLSLFIAGHGTGNSENSRRAIEDQVERLRAGGQFHDVHGVFMEEEPRIADCYRLAGTRHIVMVPFFVSDGLHSHEDIPVLLGADPVDVRARLERREPTWPSPVFHEEHWVWYSRSIGDEPSLAEVILERVGELAG
jgi:sirohydrochlorin cobaltochelatase